MNARTEQAIRDRGQEHHVAAQLNTCILDVQSYVTGYGAHNRIVAFCADTRGEVYMREDVTDLPMATDAQRRKVAAYFDRRALVWVKSEAWDDRPCVDHHYRLRSSKP